MCGASPPQDNSAEIARQQEQERQQRITQGQGAIDNAFAGYNDDYFDTYKKNYLDYYNPQIDEKYANAQRDLRYNAARAGILDSSGGQRLFGDLGKAYTDQRRAVESDALNATNQQRTNVETTKSDLYSQNTAAADPSLAAINAAGRAGALQTPPTYSPVGDLFSGLTNAGSAYYTGTQKALSTGYSNLYVPGATLPGKSGQVVNQ